MKVRYPMIHGEPNQINVWSVVHDGNLLYSFGDKDDTDSPVYSLPTSLHEFHFKERVATPSEWYWKEGLASDLV